MVLISVSDCFDSNHIFAQPYIVMSWLLMYGHNMQYIIWPYFHDFLSRPSFDEVDIVRVLPSFFLRYKVNIRRSFAIAIKVARLYMV